MAFTNTPTKLFGPVAMATTDTTLYTAPTGSGITAIIRHLTICNTTSADKTFTLGTGVSTTAANQAYNGKTVPANETLELDVYIGLNSGELFKGLCSVAGGITIQAMGVV